MVNLNPEHETTIAAAAAVILKLCKDECGARTKLERIAYAAAIIQRETVVGLEKSAEVTQ